MFDEYAIYYKTMYHIMLIAASKSVDMLISGRPYTDIMNVLLEALNKCEDIYINSPLSDSEEDRLPRYRTQYIDMEIAKTVYEAMLAEQDAESL